MLIKAHGGVLAYVVIRLGAGRPPNTSRQNPSRRLWATSDLDFFLIFERYNETPLTRLLSLYNHVSADRRHQRETYQGIHSAQALSLAHSVYPAYATPIHQTLVRIQTYLKYFKLRSVAVPSRAVPNRDPPSKHHRMPERVAFSARARLTTDPFALPLCRPPQPSSLSSCSSSSASSPLPSGPADPRPGLRSPSSGRTRRA